AFQAMGNLRHGEPGLRVREQLEDVHAFLERGRGVVMARARAGRSRISRRFRGFAWHVRDRLPRCPDPVELAPISISLAAEMRLPRGCRARGPARTAGLPPPSKYTARGGLP